MTIYGYMSALLLIAAPIAFYFLNKKILNSKYTLDDISLLSSVTIFFFLIGINILSQYQADAKLNSFDLNGDGGFTGDEMTPAFYAAAQAWTEDTNIGLLIIFGLIFCAIYYKVLAVLLKKIKAKKS